MQKKVTETPLQSGPVKRLSLAGAKPLKLTTFTTLSAVFPKAQSSQSESSQTAKNHEKMKKKSPKRTHSQDL